jgi:hypothetical protein
MNKKKVMKRYRARGNEKLLGYPKLLKHKMEYIVAMKGMEI